VTAGVAASRAEPNAFARHLFEGLPSRYNRLAAWLSLGQDPRWRAELVDHLAAARPRRVLDVACGPAAVTCSLAARTAADLVGLDLSPTMLAEGAANVRSHGLDGRVGLVLGHGEQLPFGDGAFDGVSFTYLLRYVSDPEAVLAELARVLAPGGTLASLEFAVPANPGWRAAWWGYTRVVLPVAGLALGGRPWFDVGRFLGPSISRHYDAYPVDWTLAAWSRAGLRDVAHRTMSLGGGLVIWGVRR
jgi:demethylmenaquinone methyltransferase/2-methoxy-6-polyprenyl-1,4-benzoquinol methylase